MGEAFGRQFIAQTLVFLLHLLRPSREKRSTDYYWTGVLRECDRGEEIGAIGKQGHYRRQRCTLDFLQK